MRPKQQTDDLHATEDEFDSWQGSFNYLRKEIKHSVKLLEAKFEQSTDSLIKQTQSQLETKNEVFESVQYTLQNQVQALKYQVQNQLKEQEDKIAENHS